jgi:hypothetical protein
MRRLEFGDDGGGCYIYNVRLHIEQETYESRFLCGGHGTRLREETEYFEIGGGRFRGTS